MIARSLAVLVLLVCCPLGRSQCSLLLPAPDDLQSGDYFGFCVAVDAGRLVSGARLGRQAYVYEESQMGWTQTQTLSPSNNDDTDAYGEDASILGDWLVVGAPRANDLGSESGAVYVYKLVEGVWVEHQTLTASPAGGSGRRFGQQVALQPGRLLIAAPSYTGAVAGSGAMYSFELQSDQWVEVQRFFASDGQDDDYFGVNFDVDGDRIAVGAYGHDGPGSSYTGAVWVFDHNGTEWVEVVKLVPSGPAYRTYFGTGIGLSGDRLLLGAPGDGDIANGAGAVYAYELINAVWTPRGKFYNPPGDVYGWYGYTIDLEGDRALISSPHELGQGSGAVYLVEFDSAAHWSVAWTVEQEWRSPVPSDSDAFGTVTELQDNRAYIGGFGIDIDGVDAGGVLTAVITEQADESDCTSLPNSTGQTATLTVNGSTSLSANDMVLEMEGAPSGVNGVFLMGRVAASIPFGDGVLCMAPGSPGVQRLGPVTRVNDSGMATRALDWEVLSADIEPMAGQSWTLQFYFRDPGAGATGFNFSSSVRLTLCY
jgi:FG-GAP repeat protein